MATRQPTLKQQGRRKRLTAALFVLALGSTSSVYATSGHQPPVVGPQAPPPQGTLTVYSERYVRWEDGEVAVVERRPVELQTLAGQVIGTYQNVGGEGPIRLALPPGHYLVINEGQWTQKVVQATVADGQETVVPEALFE